MAESGAADKLHELLSSEDEGFRRQGFELLETLGDPTLYDALLAGVTFASRAEHEEDVARAYDEIRPEEGSRAEELSSSVLVQLVCRAPVECAWSTVRASVQSLYCAFDFTSAALPSFDAFPSLERLYLDTIDDFDLEGGPPNLARVRALTLGHGATLLGVEHVLTNAPSLVELRFESCQLERLDVSVAPRLRRLQLEDVWQLKELVGVPSLADLETLEMSYYGNLTDDCLEELKRHPRCPGEVWVACARRLVDRERKDEAVREYGFALERDPKADTFEARARLRSKLGDYLGAVEDYTQAIERTAEPGWALFHNRAVDHENRRDHASAEADYRIALKMNPSSTLSWMGLGGVFGRVERLEEAIEAYTRAIDLGAPLETERTCINNRGDAYFRLRKYDLARLDYLRKMAIEPSCEIGLVNRAELLALEGQHALAMADAMRALEVDPAMELAQKLTTEAQSALREAGTDVLPHERIAQALVRFIAAAPEERASVIERHLPTPESYDRWLEGVEYVAEGLRRCGSLYGVLPVRPYPHGRDVSVLADFDRYLLAHAPPNSRGARVRDAVESLLVTSLPIDVRSLRAFPKLQRLWVESTSVLFADALVEIPALVSLGFSEWSFDRATWDALERMPRLRTLRMRRASAYVEMQEFAKLTQLRVLDLDWASYIGSFDVLLEMPHLEELHLPGSVDLESLPEPLRERVRRHPE